MFVGFGTLSGGAHAIGQEADRAPFQLVSAPKAAYRARQRGTTIEVGWRKESDAETVNLDDKANDAGQMKKKQNSGSDISGAETRP